MAGQKGESRSLMENLVRWWCRTNHLAKHHRDQRDDGGLQTVWTKKANTDALLLPEQNSFYLSVMVLFCFAVWWRQTVALLLA